MRPLTQALLSGAVALTISGCVETGDFGRVKRSAWNDVVAGTGSLAAAARGEAVSGFPLTDDEAELRERAWRFLVPAHGRATLDTALAELVATRVLPPSAAAPDRRAYLDELLATDARSPVSRYRRLADDILADARLISPFVRTARRVLGADGIRLQVLARTASATPVDAAEAGARVLENRCLVAWVAAATSFRTVSYGDALAGLVIASPGTEAVPAERALAVLVEERVALDRFGIRPLVGDACLGEPGDRPIVRERVLVTKG